jgi:hypothetical protein
MAEPESREATYKAQTAEQFEAIGRFVQAFELMVDATRMASYSILSQGDPKRGQLVNVVLFHQSMTAKPHFDIMRGLYGVLIQEYPTLLQDDKETINAVLKFCANEHEKLTNLRNDLLHGTWHIGWASPDQQDFSEMLVHKAKVWTSGYKFADLPKTAAELFALAKRCDDLTTLLYRLYGAVLPVVMSGQPSRVRFNVRKADDRWLPEPPASQSA